MNVGKTKQEQALIDAALVWHAVNVIDGAPLRAVDKKLARACIALHEFQSDKYPTCPPGKVPLSVKDPTAQDLLWEYAQRRRAVDAEFADDLEFALRNAGYEPSIGQLIEKSSLGPRGTIHGEPTQAEIDHVMAMVEAAEREALAAEAAREDEIARLRATILDVLASASPNERDHPAMSAAWKRARAALAGGGEGDRG